MTIFCSSTKNARTIRFRTHLAQREPPYALETVRCVLLNVLYTFGRKCAIYQSNRDTRIYTNPIMRNAVQCLPLLETVCNHRISDPLHVSYDNVPSIDHLRVHHITHRLLLHPISVPGVLTTLILFDFVAYEWRRRNCTRLSRTIFKQTDFSQ